MNAVDKKKVTDAMANVGGLDDKLNDILKRGPLAIKAWQGTLNNARDDVKQALQSKIIPAMAKMLKNAKSLKKDLANVIKEFSDPKKLDKYPTARDYREKANKLLSPAKAFELETLRFTAALRNILGSNMYPGQGDVNIKASVGYLDDYSIYLNRAKFGLSKL